MQSIQFKFKFVDDDGNPEGILSKKGSLQGEILQLDDLQLPVALVRKTERRFDRLVLSVLGDGGDVSYIILQITGGSGDTLRSALNAVSSRAWAQMRKEHLEEVGKGEYFRTRVCPHCDAMLDLSQYPETPQVFCRYCDAVVVLNREAKRSEGDYKICDSCGYFSRPQEYTIFYFYFLLVIYGFSHRKVYLCPNCMKPEAWKMLGGNFLFLLGLPVALYQLFKVYSADGDKSLFPDLHAANREAQDMHADEALELYSHSDYLWEPHGHAGVLFNRGLAQTDAGFPDKGAQEFEQALQLCCNHDPSLEGLASCYQAMGETDKLEALLASYGSEGDAEEPAQGAHPDDLF